MAYYISEDGRLHTFDAEIKADGTVRPKSYRDFTEGKTITPSRQDAGARRRYNQYLTTPDRKKNKTTFHNTVSVPAIPRSKREACKSDIMTLLVETQMSVSARDFVRVRAMCLSAIPISNKLKRKICDAALDYEMNTIIDVISQINAIIESYLDYKQIIGTNRTKARTQTQKCTTSIVTSHTEVLSSQRSQVLGVVESVQQNPQHINSTIYVRKGMAPKYGYARDYFGRVQERDSYREDRPVNPYTSLSNYDKEDDNESLDIL